MTDWKYLKCCSKSKWTFRIGLKNIKSSKYQNTQVVIMWVLLLSLSLVVRDVYANNNRYSEGLNRWSFLSNDEIFSDQLCPNPMNENRIISSSKKFSLNSSATLIVRGDGSGNSNIPVPNDIWALKTSSPMTFLPCDLRSATTNFPSNHNNNNNAQFGRGRVDASARVENKMLFMNLSFVPFDFIATKGKLCTKFIKLQFDEEEGVELNCDENPLDIDAVANHIYWPRDAQKRRKSFSIFRNLERFLKHEEHFRKKFYFQIYFTSKSGQNKKCTVQQYELNLSNPGGGCNSGRPTKIEHVCGEFGCDDLIFPFYGDDNRVKFIWKSGELAKDGKPTLLFHPDYLDKPTINGSSRSFFNFDRKLDVRFIIVLTMLPIVIFGMLVFSLELIIYISCLKRSNSSGRESSGRDNQILQNSLNLWESIPNREARSVSFSPVTTNIDATGSESPIPDPLTLTPGRVLKSALKKSTEHLPPPPASFFEMEREYPPTYVEAMKH